MTFSFHPYNYHRVIVPAMNSPVLSSTFKCKPESRMNAEKSALSGKHQELQDKADLFRGFQMSQVSNCRNLLKMWSFSV